MGSLRPSAHARRERSRASVTDCVRGAYQRRKGSELDKGHDRAAVALGVNIQIQSPGLPEYIEHAAHRQAQQVKEPKAQGHLLADEVGEAHHWKTHV